MNIYDFKIKTMDEKEVSMADYKGKVLLIVNTATGCGFTPQYDGLQDLYEKYQAKGFEILDFPCNQFLGQAPGSGEAIHSFCTGRYGITFPQFAKIKVNGRNQEPLYEYLKANVEGKKASNIKWNFTKFLVTKDGRIVERFEPIDTPAKIDGFVAKLLEE